jgi:UDP-glucose 6-dehydrogenase
VIEVNELQKRRVIGKLRAHLGDLRGKRVALLGLAFKPNTDDMREASSVVLASRLRAEGVEVRAYDPVAGPNARRVLDPERHDLRRALALLEPTRREALPTRVIVIDVTDRSGIEFAISCRTTQYCLGF